MRVACALFFLVLHVASNANAQVVAAPHVPAGYGEPAPTGLAPIPNAPSTAHPSPATISEPDGPTLAPGETGTRSGFALQLGNGFGIAGAASPRVGTMLQAAFGVGLGGYLSERTALFARGIVSLPIVVESDDIVFYGALLFHAQHWVTERWMLGAGVGVAGVVATFLDGDGGFAVPGELRLGYALAHWTHHSLLVVASAQMLFIGSSSITTGCLTFEWQVH